MLTYVYQGRKTLYPEPLSGVYLIMRDDTVWYVGKAKNFANRITKHHEVIKALYSKKPKPIKAYLFPVSADKIYQTESDLIQLFQPIYNLNKR
jgi:excinuclease UvrABC nuclease subunit